MFYTAMEKGATLFDSRSMSGLGPKLTSPAFIAAALGRSSAL
jgi:hypothetical protein